jgi:hypothetical protein
MIDDKLEVCFELLISIVLAKRRAISLTTMGAPFALRVNLLHELAYAGKGGIYTYNEGIMEGGVARAVLVQKAEGGLTLCAARHI